MPTPPVRSGLLTDLYELTMAAGYVQTGFRGRATFELFTRSLPPRRNFLVAAGLEQALEFLQGLSFSHEQISYLREHPAFAGIQGNFFDYLASFRFSGDVWAMPEGTVCFPGEPLLRVTAPIVEAQIVETALLASREFPDHGGIEGRPLGGSCRRPSHRRIRIAPRPWNRVRCSCGARRIHRRMPRHVECRGRSPVRRSHLRHAGPFLDHGA